MRLPIFKTYRFFIMLAVLLLSLLYALPASALTVNPTTAGRPGDGIQPVAVVAAPPAAIMSQVEEPPLLVEASADWWGQVQQNLAEGEYRASPTPHGLQAPNRANNWRVYFEPTGVQVVERSAGEPELAQLRLVGWGRANRLELVQPSVVVNQGRRVEIRRAGLVEWYVNSPQGLEQGFELADRPAGEGEVWLDLAVVGAQVRLEGEQIILRSVAGRTLSYHDLHVYDAAGRSLPARFEAGVAPDQGKSRLIGAVAASEARTQEELIHLIITDTDAAYPLTVDPLLTATADALLESNQVNAILGTSMAGAGDVNRDGYTDVIVGRMGMTTARAMKGRPLSKGLSLR